MWNSINIDYENSDDFPEEILYISSPSCTLLNRRNSIETAYRSDSFNYKRIFPFAPAIQENNAIIATISDNSGNTYRVRRMYINTSNNPNLESDPYTLRVKYTVETVNENNTVTQFPFEHTSDINLIAQYFC